MQRVVLQPFAHLLAVLSQDEAVADQALEGGLPKQGCGQHHQGVEPAPGLVNACTAAPRSNALMTCLSVDEPSISVDEPSMSMGIRDGI